MAQLQPSADVDIPTATELQPPQPSLGALPPELKQLIVEMALEIDIEDADAEDGFEDEDEEASEDKEKPDASMVEAKTREPHSAASEEGEDGARWKPSHCLIALSMVDSAFYELCRPLIWKDLDTATLPLSKLIDLRETVVKRQGHLVQTLWWRVSPLELEEHGDLDLYFLENKPLEYDPTDRAEAIFSILRLCPNVVEIDMDMYVPAANSPTAQLAEYVRNNLEGLTDLALTATGEHSFARLPENEVVEMISKKPKLVGFTADGVERVAAGVFQNALGRHLSQLPRLTRLDFTEANCVDDEWADLDWKAGIELLALDECERITAKGLHALCHRFSSTLRNLTLDRVPRLDGSPESRAAVDGMSLAKNRYRLPKLEGLSLTSGEIPIAFIRSFAECASLKHLDLGDLPDIEASEIEAIVSDKVFPLLEKIRITNDATFSTSEIESLELFCHSRGVEVEVEPEDEDEDDMSISSTYVSDVSDLPDLPNGGLEISLEGDFLDDMDDMDDMHSDGTADYDSDELAVGGGW